MATEHPPLMDPADADAYTSGLGKVFGGSYELIALAQRLRVPESLGLSTQEWVTQRLGGYIRLTIEDRRLATAELRQLDEEITNREIAAVLGVSSSTISLDDKALKVEPEVEEDADIDAEFEEEVPNFNAIAETNGYTEEDVSLNATEVLKDAIDKAFADPPLSYTIHEAESKARLAVSYVFAMQTAARDLLAVDTQEMAESWAMTRQHGRLADILMAMAEELQTYVASVRAAKATHLTTVK